MKFRITLKDPDGFSNCVDEAIRKSVLDLDLSEDEADAVFERRQEHVYEELERWFEYNEYVSIDIDLSAMTAEVVEA